jgi:hypothetical protein
LTRLSHCGGQAATCVKVLYFFNALIQACRLSLVALY